MEVCIGAEVYSAAYSDDINLLKIAVWLYRTVKCIRMVS